MVEGSQPLKWIDTLLNMDTELEYHARKNGQAKLEIFYYGQRDGVVRKRVFCSPQRVKEYYSKGDSEED